MVLLLTLLVVTPIISALVGHALSRGWLTPNGFVGLRTPRTLRDHTAWMLTHAAFGRVTARTVLLPMVAALLCAPRGESAAMVAYASVPMLTQLAGLTAACEALGAQDRTLQGELQPRSGAQTVAAARREAARTAA